MDRVNRDDREATKWNDLRPRVYINLLCPLDRLNMSVGVILDVLADRCNEVRK